VAAIPKPSQKQQRPLPKQLNASTLFFSLNQDDIIKDSSNDEDNGSEVSNLSFPEDDGADDGASAATLAVGRHALKTLLQKVQTDPKRERRPATRERKSQPHPPSGPENRLWMRFFAKLVHIVLATTIGESRFLGKRRKCHLQICIGAELIGWKITNLRLLPSDQVKLRWMLFSTRLLLLDKDMHALPRRKHTPSLI
jgi:hypothetical protein